MVPTLTMGLRMTFLVLLRAGRLAISRRHPVRGPSARPSSARPEKQSGPGDTQSRGPALQYLRCARRSRRTRPTKQLGPLRDDCSWTTTTSATSGTWKALYGHSVAESQHLVVE